MMERFYNPVLVKELKLRFRSFKSFSGLMFYLAVLCIFIAGFYCLQLNLLAEASLNQRQAL